MFRKNFIPNKKNKKFDKNSKSFFDSYSLGINTNRDAWSYNSSLEQVKVTAKSSINSSCPTIFENNRKKRNILQTTRREPNDCNTLYIIL